MLDAEVRRAVSHQAGVLMHARSRVLYWLPQILSVAGGIAGWFAANAALLLIQEHLVSVSREVAIRRALLLALPSSYAGIMIGGLLGGSVGLLIQRSKLRPFIRKVLNSYGVSTRK